MLLEKDTYFRSECNLLCRCTISSFASVSLRYFRNNYFSSLNLAYVNKTGQIADSYCLGLELRHLFSTLGGMERRTGTSHRYNSLSYLSVLYYFDVINCFRLFPMNFPPFRFRFYFIFARFQVVNYFSYFRSRIPRITCRFPYTDRPTLPLYSCR